MSPRIKKPRKVLNPPPIKGFKPYGADAEAVENEPVLLHFEEYEALRLCDYDMYNHHQASEVMGVSRPTFTRVYASARQKVAKAFAEGRQITIDGGKVYFDSDWYSCKRCKCYFNNPQKDVDIVQCPLCGDPEILGCEDLTDCYGSGMEPCSDLCVCISCGYEMPHDHGRPCNHYNCPQCGKRMIRKSK